MLAPMYRKGREHCIEYYKIHDTDRCHDISRQLNLETDSYGAVITVAVTGGKGSLNWGIHADYIVVF